MGTALTHPPKARAGDKVAVLCPSFAAPGFAPEVHEQAMERLAKLAGPAQVHGSIGVERVRVLLAKAFVARRVRYA